MSQLLDIIKGNLTYEKIKEYCIEAINNCAKKSPEVLEVKEYLNVISYEFKDNLRLEEVYNLGITAAMNLPIIQTYIITKINPKEVKSSLID